MDKNKIHTEQTFETAIIEHLTENAWIEVSNKEYDRELAFFPNVILTFVKESQPKEWGRLQQFYKDEADVKFLQRLYRELELRGSLDVIRHGITDSGVKFQLAYFQPDTN